MGHGRLGDHRSRARQSGLSRSSPASRPARSMSAGAKRAVAFGSYARGVADAWSDLDLAVVMSIRTSGDTSAAGAAGGSSRRPARRISSSTPPPSSHKGMAGARVCSLRHRSGRKDDLPGQGQGDVGADVNDPAAPLEVARHRARRPRVRAPRRRCGVSRTGLLPTPTRRPTTEGSPLRAGRAGHPRTRHPAAHRAS